MHQTQVFSVECHADPRGHVVRLCGEVHLGNADRLKAVLGDMADRKPRLVVLDLSSLTFITSLGLGLLLGFRHDLALTGGTLRLAAATPEIADMLCKTRLIDLFPVYESADKALAGS